LIDGKNNSNRKRSSVVSNISDDFDNISINDEIQEISDDDSNSTKKEIVKIIMGRKESTFNFDQKLKPNIDLDNRKRKKSISNDKNLLNENFSFGKKKN
jgi:hypothetical protein